MIDIKSQIIKPALNLEDLRVVASAEGWKLTDLHSLGFFLNRNFKYRRKITITEQSGSDLTDYQVLIELNSTNFDFSHAQTNGEDIRFTDADGNLLDYWIEEWDAVNEIAKVWVKVPPIPANSSVEISMFYGNSEITSASDGASTFIRIIDGVVGSWHFDEGSGTIAYDSSGNDNDGTINGATRVDGKYGKALDFDGSDDCVEVANADSLNPTDITIEAWINLASDPSTWSYAGGIVYKLYSYQWNVDTNSKLWWGIWGAALHSNYVFSSDDIGQWHHTVITFEKTGDNQGYGKIYVDGSLDNEGSLAEDIDATTEPVYIGRKVDGGYFHGIIDEVRIYNQVLTAQEISDLYNNYGYTTENYPGKVLVRKYTEPEPSVSISEEETA